VTVTAAPASGAAESRSAAASAVPQGLRRAVMALAIGLIIATCVFGAGRVIWRVISMDGGWYSYPGYALSEGRDPDENLLPPEHLSLAAPGVRSLFPWENRSFLLTRIDWAWFDLAGHGQASIVTFGVLQWLALAALVGWGVLCATGSRWAAGAAALAASSDVQLVYESLADLRPDVPLALIGIAALCFLVNYLRRRSPVSFIACGFLTALLPLVHTTGVMPAAMMLTCVAMSALIPRDGRPSKPYMLACAMLVAVTLAVFIFRKPIADVLIPTQVPLADQLPGRHDLPAMVLGMAHRGVGWKLAQERQRWTSYFLGGNVPQLLFLLTGLIALLRAAWRLRSEMAAWLLLPAGWLAGIVVLTGVGWSLLLDRRLPVVRTQGVLALAVLAFLCLGLRTAQAAVDIDQGIHQGVSRAAVSRMLTKVFPGTGVTWAVGPTSIWMYVPQSGRTVIVDQRSDPGIVRTALWRRISILVIDTDFLKWGWGGIARQGVAAGWLRPIGQVGKPGDKYWLEAFSVEHTGAPGNGGH
jgi:hypothetical protein